MNAHSVSFADEDRAEPYLLFEGILGRNRALRPVLEPESLSESGARVPRAAGGYSDASPEFRKAVRAEDGPKGRGHSAARDGGAGRAPLVGQLPGDGKVRCVLRGSAGR